MSINYLGKNRPIYFDSYNPAAQLVQATHVGYTTRCAWCHYQEPFRTNKDFVECLRKRGCGSSDLLFMPMITQAFGQGGSARNFTYTPFFKQYTTNYIKRYLQLLQCRLSGYQCNKLCQFYPQRIDSEQSVSDCASSHACGRNGSFWTLLTPKYGALSNWPKLDWTAPSPLPLLRADGQLIEDVEINSIQRNENGYLTATLSDGNTYFIACYIPDSNMSGYLFKTPVYNRKYLWHPDEFHMSIYDLSQVLLTWWGSEPLSLRLVEEGMPEDNFYRPMQYLQNVNIGNNVYQWFYYYRHQIDLVEVDNIYIVVITAADGVSKYIVTFGSAGVQCLGCKYNDNSPSAWVKVTKPVPLTIDAIQINITGYDDGMAAWLRTIGCKKSLFLF